MSEREVVERTQSGPATVESLASDLAALGVGPGMVLLVHSSLSSLGWVCGGAVAVILALEQALGETGTLVMPAHCGDLSDPAKWENPPVPESWWDTIRSTMPAYDRDLTPTCGTGAIGEAFRKQRGVVRSDHPQMSFAAWGAQAEQVTSEHALHCGVGEDSPLARLYDMDGWVLLLGVGHDNNTSLHLAEHRATSPGRKTVITGAPMLVDGQREWVVFQELDRNDSDFGTIGENFAAETGEVRQRQVAGATALLFRQRSLIDFAVGWMEANRS